MKGLGRRLALGGVTAVALIVPGCGGNTIGPGAVLTAATSHIGEIRAGALSVRFSLSPNGLAASSTVGVLIRGTFALDRRHRLPIMHVMYTRVAGTQSRSTEIDSDGRSATTGPVRQRIPLTAQQQQLLSATLQGPQGLGSLPLHLDRWVDHPRQIIGPRLGAQPTDQITGTVNLSHALTDLNQLSGGQVNEAGHSASVDSALKKTLRSSSFLAVVGHDDHLLRRLELRMVLVPVDAPTTGAPSQGLTIALAVALTPGSLPR